MIGAWNIINATKLLLLATLLLLGKFLFQMVGLYITNRLLPHRYFKAQYISFEKTSYHFYDEFVYEVDIFWNEWLPIY